MTGRIQLIIGAVVILAAFLAILPFVVTQVVTAQATTGLDDGASAILGLVPLVAIVGGVAIAGTIAIAAGRSGD